MPNTGQKSPNCHLCRQRRVKCDLTRPACLRCIKYGVECPGYRKEGDLTFKTQIGTYVSRTRKPSHLALAAVRGSQVAPFEAGLASSGGSGGIVIGSSFASSSLPLQSLPLPTSSAAFMLRRFSVSIRGCDHYGEIWDFLPDLYHQERGNLCLSICSDTFRETCLANEQGRLNDKETFIRSARLLAAATRATQHRESVGSNGTLLSIFLLAIHELLLGTPEKDLVPAPDAWHTHVKGLSSIIKLRGPGQFKDKHGRALFFMAFSTVQTRSLILNTECPPESSQWLQLLKFYSGDSPVLQSTCVVFTYVCDVCSLLKQIVSLSRRADSTPDIRGAELLGLWRKAEEIEQPMLAQVSQRSPLPCSCPSSQLHLWNLFRASRCKLHCWLIRAYNSVTTEIAHLDVLVALHDYCRGSHFVASAMAEGIVKDAAGILGEENPVHLHIQNAADLRSHEINATACWMDALRLLWPLTLVSRTSIVSQEQRMRARRLLAVIGGNLGIFEARKYSGMARASFCVF
ncbi:hypothetical protein F4808DRAFT_440326 [Astrocystis sublimbata]|nr:hypothetical protein F4808DRAFT_440326 [Astrocystis sublimbata]